MVEIIVVAIIIGLLVAILTPVASIVLNVAKETSSASNLRQIFVASDLYRTDYDGQGVYGTSYQVGLPDYLVIYDRRTNLGDLLPGTGNLWASPCGSHPDNPHLSEVGTNMSWNPIALPGEL